MTYYLCDSKRAFCPASGLERSKRLTMWDEAAMDAAFTLEGVERKSVVSQAIGRALSEELGITPESDEVERLATSLIHIASGNCPLDKIARIGY